MGPMVVYGGGGWWHCHHGGCDWAMHAPKRDRMAQSIAEAHAGTHDVPSPHANAFLLGLVDGFDKHRATGLLTSLVMLPAVGAVMAVAVWGSMC